MGNSISNLLGNIAGGNKPAAAANQPGYFKHIGITDGDAAYDTMAEVIAIAKTLTTGQFGLLWSKTIPPQQKWAWGYGSPVLSENQGYLWFAIIDVTTEFMAGQLRLQQCDANRYKTIVVQEFADSQLHSVTNTTLATATLTDKRQMLALPESVQYPTVGQDSKIELWYKHESGTLANIDSAGFKIPATIYPL